MGHSQNNWQSANKPEKEALETKQNKGVKDIEESTAKAKKKRKETEKPEKKKEETEKGKKPKKSAEEPEETLEAPEEIAEELEPEVEELLEELPEEETAEAKVEESLEEEETVEEEEKLEVEKKREEVEEEIVEERIYTIPLQRAWISPRKKRTPRAVRLVKTFIQRHMKPEDLVMSNEVNEKLWSRSIQKPPRRIRVRAVRDKEGTVTLYLAEGD